MEEAGRKIEMVMKWNGEERTMKFGKAQDVKIKIYRGTTE